MDIGVIYIVIAAFFGAIGAAVMGWLDSGEPFVIRKFMSSVLRALVAAGVFAVGYQLSSSTPTVVDFIAAFLAGAGVDVIGNRVAGSIRSN